MTQEEVETVVLETVRRYSPNGKASEETRIEKDLRLTELARQRLFASLVEAFNARGTNLPSRGYFLSNFNACPTVADVQSAICAALFAKSAPKGKGGHGAHAAHAPKPAHAPEPEKARTQEPAPEARPVRATPPEAAPVQKATPIAEVTPASDAQPAQTGEGTLPEGEAPKKKRTAAKKKPAKKAAKKKPTRKTAPKRKPRTATEADGAATPAAEPATPTTPQDAPPAGPAVAA